jgi:hypothetical protein
MQRFLAVCAALMLGCAPAGDDDDSARTIPPPDGCSLTSLSTVVFQFHIHWGGVEYPQGELIDLLNAQGFDSFVFPFGGEVTEFGPDPDSNFQALTVTELAPEDTEPLEDPNWLRVVYQLPLGYTLPTSLAAPAGVELNLDLSGEDLIAAFSLWDLPPDGDPEIAFLAEPTDLGMAYAPGPDHPFFESVSLRDRACPNLTEQPCASTYNLSIEFRTKQNDDATAGGDTFELWPTEAMDFDLGGPSYRVVNAWSFTHREIQDCVNPYDFTAERKSFFVTRSEAAP